MRLSRPAGVLLALALAAPAAAQPAAPRVPTVAVTGTGEVELKPDLARILVTVGTQADSATQAADLNRAATDRVLARLQGLAVKRDDIRTMNVQVFPTPPRTRPDGSEAKVPRFTASHQLRIVTRDIDVLKELASVQAADVCVSVTTLDEQLRRVMEPRAATSERRLDAIARLNEAGIPAGVMMAAPIPFAPHSSSTPATASAGTITQARSGTSGRAVTLGKEGRPITSLAPGLTA